MAWIGRSDRNLSLLTRRSHDLEDFARVLRLFRIGVLSPHMMIVFGSAAVFRSGTRRWWGPDSRCMFRVTSLSNHDTNQNEVSFANENCSEKRLYFS